MAVIISHQALLAGSAGPEWAGGNNTDGTSKPNVAQIKSLFENLDIDINYEW